MQMKFKNLTECLCRKSSCAGGFSQNLLQIEKNSLENFTQLRNSGRLFFQSSSEFSLKIDILKNSTSHSAWYGTPILPCENKGFRIWQSANLESKFWKYPRFVAIKVFLFHHVQNSKSLIRDLRSYSLPISLYVKFKKFDRKSPRFVAVNVFVFDYMQNSKSWRKTIWGIWLLKVFDLAVTFKIIQKYPATAWQGTAAQGQRTSFLSVNQLI